MSISKEFLINLIKKQVQQIESSPEVEKVGKVLEVGDGIARISGLSSAMMSEMIEFPNQIYGLVLNLEEGVVGAAILGDHSLIKEGDLVKSTQKILSVPVSEDLIGRVIDPLGNPLDGQGPIKAEKYYPVEKIAPGVVYREPVSRPLQTGIKAIDSMIPIGRGQRELIIGDRQTGKTAIAIDTIINQRGQDVICIYVAIGQKDSKTARIIKKLEETKALDYTIVVSSSASSPAILNYIAPYAGCAIGEYFMDQGKDVLIVYDDLSKHAWAYRQVALLLRRPPGREAYPGDIFYLHSRLLERSAKLSKTLGGGSLTALPIIETQAGDISAYIPTNVISITDGQIYLESDLFYRGIRPAINIGLSVSRVGGAAQIKAMKKVAGRLRLDLAQYRELEAFAQFASELDPTTKQQIERGRRLVEILKQDQYKPMPVEKQVAILYSAVNGFLDEIPLEKIKEWEEKFLIFLETAHFQVLEQIKEKKELDQDLEKLLQEAIKEFQKTF